MTTLTRRFDDAFQYAHELHASDTRKGTNAPYIGHLMGVASIVLDDGGTEDEAIAALLHDAAEDHGGRPRVDEIRARFGSAVARIVEDCTDSWETPKRPWIERKTAYVDHARRLTSIEPARVGRRQGSQHLRDPARLAEHRRGGLETLQREPGRCHLVLPGARAHRTRRPGAEDSSTNSNASSEASSGRWGTDGGGGLHQPRSASAYARKNTPPARALRCRRRLGLIARQPTIIWAYLCSARHCRNSAAAVRTACGIFFELTQRAGRIALRD